MTEQEHLECEIQESQIELELHKQAIERLKIRIENKKKELEEMKPITKEGLFDKYFVLKGDHTGVPVDFPCFVLRVDGTDSAAMSALSTYADHCEEPLATELRELVKNTPIRQNDEEFLDDAEYMLNFEVEGLTDDQYETLKVVVMMARESLEKNTGSLENTEKPVVEVLRDLVNLVVPEPGEPALSSYAEGACNVQRAIRAEFLMLIKMMEQ